MNKSLNELLHQISGSSATPIRDLLDKHRVGIHSLMTTQELKETLKQKGAGDSEIAGKKLKELRIAIQDIPVEERVLPESHLRQIVKGWKAVISSDIETILSRDAARNTQILSVRQQILAI